MKRQKNPYPKRDGFGFRYLRAKAALEKFGRNCMATPYSRSFDTCFEMDDGDALVWALMHAAIRNMLQGDTDLERGIHNMGDGMWAFWLTTYQPTVQGGAA